MKKTMFNFLAILVTVAVFFSSCASLKKMAQRASEIKYEVKPSPLEMHAKSVKVNISVSFPQKYFLKKAELICTPVLKNSDGTETALEQFTLQGEDVQGQGTTIKYEGGGSFNYEKAIAYVDPMRSSVLQMRVQGKMKTKTMDIKDPRLEKLAVGVITTPELVEGGLKLDVTSGTAFTFTSAAKPVQDLTSIFSADLHYDMQQSSLKSTEATSEDVKKLIDAIIASKDNQEKKLKAIEVSSFASPDGPQTLNDNLSKDRTKTADKFLNDKLKKEPNAKDLKSSMVEKSTAEDWEGFEKAMQSSTIKDKDLVLRVLKMYSDPEVREKEIKNITAVFTQIKDDVLPKLRRSDIKAIYEGMEKTDADYANIAISNPSSLKQDELLYAGQATTDNAKRLQIYQNYAKAYPKDWRGPSNIGYIYASQGKLDLAKESFTAAKNIEENTTTLTNFATILLLEGKSDEAEKMYQAAAAKGAMPEANSYGQGVVQIKKGNYPQAVKCFEACQTPTFNQALAKVLNKDNSGALKTLTDTKRDDAKIFYLKAIIGARTDNTTVLFDSLKQAIAKDASLKEYAKKDLEFAKYFEDGTFTTIVK